MENLICYCFGYTEADVIKDVYENDGNSLILERIITEKKKGSCKCSITHPLGK